LLKPTRGGVRIWDTDIAEMDEAHLASIRREKVAFVYQSFNLLEALTALENVSLLTTQRALNGATAADLDAPNAATR
jgi:putative ABC transport system ATP-binding protein